MAKLNRLPYHARRILGQLCVLPKDAGKSLDGFDKSRCRPLEKHGYISHEWFGQDLVTSATDSGRKAWSEFINQGAKP